MEEERRQFGEFVIDRAHNTVTSSAGSQQVPARVMDVLLYLMKHRDRVVPTDELLSTFWEGRIVEESTIHRIISQIRNALGDSARNPRYIRTVSKRGYQAVAEVGSVTDTDSITTAASADIPAPLRGSTSPSRRHILLGASALALAMLGLVLLWQSPAWEAGPSEADTMAANQAEIAALNSIAVLPFVNLSDDPELGYFAVGLADILLDELVRQDLRVAARTSTFQAADRMDLAATARTLNVAYVIEGSIQNRGDDLRVTTQLIRASDGYHVWSKTYDEPGISGFDTQTLIAANAARLTGSMLHTDVMNQRPELFEHLQGIDAQAVEYFLEGQKQFELYVLGEGGDLDHSVQLMRNAAAADPAFAAAHREVAWASMQRLDHRQSISEASLEAHSAIARALAIEPESGDTLLQLAQIHINLDLDYASAEAVIRRGLELHPQGRWWYPLLAEIAFREGRTADGLRLLNTASAFDFGEEQVTFLHLQAVRLVTLEEFDRALEITAEALRLTAGGDQRASVLRIRALALIRQGETDRARDLIDEAWQLAGMKEPESFGHLFAAIGEAARAREILAEAETQPGNFFFTAFGHLELGDIDDALRWLDYGIDEHDPEIIRTLRVGNLWNELQDEPRYQALIGKLDAMETRTRM